MACELRRRCSSAVIAAGRCPAVSGQNQASPAGLLNPGWGMS